MMTCPFCGDRIELTVSVDAYLDPTDLSVEAASSGGSMRVYCINSCAEWDRDLTWDWGEGDGWPTPAECMDAITNAIELATGKRGTHATA